MAAILKKLQKIRFFISRKLLILEKKCLTKNEVLEILCKEGFIHNFRNLNRLKTGKDMGSKSQAQKTSLFTKRAYMFWLTFERSSETTQTNINKL